MTKTLRNNELGILSFGTDSSPYGIAIPPKSKFNLKTYCFKDCTNQMLENENITLFSALPHTHLTGFEVWTKMIRNEVDIGYLFRNKYYDFNYQNNYLLDPRFTIQKGDEFITECSYDTKNRTNFTLGGLGTDKEMCLHFFSYYPRRVGLKACWSMPSIKEYENFMLNLNKSGDVNIKNLYDPYELDLATDELFDQLNANRNKMSLKKKFEKFYNETNVHMMCNEFNEKVYSQLKPKESIKYVDKCGRPDN
ncbi:unnamed protein product [Brachionus calyciflorus]|uniref:Copper type II ascorbate-dependent monooxygenase C-terminal domain-containing protein n=1 Tax=Brachionus calyciflorus TaxID=104777 RepID=A0A813PH23_9BILA|nr:unnamed protein product [Brachionus calyciflorus]